MDFTLSAPERAAMIPSPPPLSETSSITDVSPTLDSPFFERPVRSMSSSSPMPPPHPPHISSRVAYSPIIAMPSPQMSGRSDILDLPPPPPRAPKGTPNSNHRSAQSHHSSSVNSNTPNATTTTPAAAPSPTWTRLSVSSIDSSPSTQSGQQPYGGLSVSQGDVDDEGTTDGSDNNLLIRTRSYSSGSHSRARPPLPTRPHMNDHIFIGVHGGDVARAGSTVRGVISIFIEEGLQTAARLCLRLYGEEHTCWVEDHNSTYTRYEDGNEICNETIIVKMFANQAKTSDSLLDDEEKAVQLLHGPYAFPFKIDIPAHCPRSFLCELDHIRYTLRALVEDHTGAPLLSCTKPILVMESLITPPPEPPIAHEERKFMFAGDHPMICYAKLNAAVYTPGDELTVCNPTSRSVGRITVTVKQKVTLMADGHTRIIERSLVRGQHENAFIDGHVSHAERQVTVRLPAPCLASVTKGRLINVSTEVIVDIGVSMGTDIFLSLPFTLAENDGHMKLLQVVHPRPRVLHAKHLVTVANEFWNVFGTSNQDIVMK